MFLISNYSYNSQFSIGLYARSGVGIFTDEQNQLVERWNSGIVEWWNNLSNVSTARLNLTACRLNEVELKNDKKI